jgi:hypothetical protein
MSSRDRNALLDACANARVLVQGALLLPELPPEEGARYNPHIHVLAADGAFDADGVFRALPPIPRKLLESAFRKGVLDLLRREGLVSDLMAERMLAWRHTWFSVHNAVRVHARDAAGRRRLAQYMLRAPFSLEKMSYEPVSGIVIYARACTRPSSATSRSFRRRLAGAALPPHPRLVRAPRALRRLVLEPQPRKAQTERVRTG